MPRRNRVTPEGEIVAAPERGTLFGNRGVLHNDEGALVREWQVRRWIACRLDFKGRRRKLLQPGRYTELFFLDEATSLAAGHRPCAECRREDFNRFKSAWPGVAAADLDVETIDRRLHAERLTANGGKLTFTAAAGDLPDATMVRAREATWLLAGGRLYRWTPGGYAETRRVRAATPLEVLTPATTVAVLHAGYEPAIHPTAR
jgi:hypothetical protein